eukprot:scaffold2640_cov376-Prasinococcus_capsulatus_cf.AAC.6
MAAMMVLVPAVVMVRVPAALPCRRGWLGPRAGRPAPDGERAGLGAGEKAHTFGLFESVSCSGRPAPRGLWLAVRAPFHSIPCPYRAGSHGRAVGGGMDGWRSWAGRRRMKRGCVRGVRRLQARPRRARAHFSAAAEGVARQNARGTGVGAAAEGDRGCARALRSAPSRAPPHGLGQVALLAGSAPSMLEP